MKLGLSLLTVLATPIAVNAISSHDVNAEYRESIFYNNNKPANWWYNDGTDWYFFQNSKPRFIFMVTILQKRRQACQVLYSAVTIVSILILGKFKKKFSHD